MKRLIWTRLGRECPKNQFEISDHGLKVITAGSLLVTDKNIMSVELKAAVRTQHPLLLLFSLADYFGELILCTKQIVLMPDREGTELSLDFIGIKDEMFTIPSNTHLVNMVVLNLDYCNLFEVSDKQFKNI